MLSIIIPTFNEELSLGALLDAVTALRGPLEVIVADGGSDDRTVSIARDRGVRVVTAERGRGNQMRAGAALARGDVFWFLHADTVPPADATERIDEALRDTTVAGGNFAVRFDGESRAARFLTWLYPQGRRLGLCYGESAIFARRSAYEDAGGMQPIPLFEDLDLVRRLARRGCFVHVRSTVVASSRRFEGRSFVRTYTGWVSLQLLYWAGVSPYTLARLYAPIRGAGTRRKGRKSD